MKKLFKAALILASATLIAGPLASCGDKPVDPPGPVEVIDVTSITVSPTALNLKKDETKTLEVVVLPENASNKSLSFVSSNSEIATVSSAGLVTAVKAGTATIAVSSVSNPSVSKQVVVTVTEDPVYVVRGCDEAPNYATYKINKGVRDNKLAEFVTKDLSYKVGDDNAISFKPVLHVFLGRQEVDPSNYTGGFAVKVKEKVNESYVDAQTADYAVNETDATIDFAETAIGKTYKLSVCPKAIDESFIEDFTHEYVVDVVDGYNVTKVEELSLFDTTDNSYAYDGGGDVAGLHSAWADYKTAHNIPLNLHPSTLILHANLMLSEDALPSNFFYTAEEAASWSSTEKERSIGSLKDFVYLYVKTTEGDLNINGNYFAIDWSKIPLVTRTVGAEQTPSNKLNCHSSTFRVENGNLNFENVGIIGNSHVAKTDADIKFDGGLIGFKFAKRTATVKFTNTLEHGCYIGVMSEGTDEANDPAAITIKDAKFYDNNNCFLYNWGGNLIAKNSLFEGCGGPVVIQDHTGVEIPEEGAPEFDRIDTVNGKFIINGHDPHTTFEDCTINNYVIGTESWFKSFGAEEIAPVIKQMSDTLSSISLSAQRTFIFNSDHKGVLAQTEQGETVFNFIVLNKSSEAEGITAYMVDGDVKFINSGAVTDHFNYLRPNDMTAQTKEELDRFTAECTLNQQFRGVNGAGAPIFETKGGTYCIANENPLILSTIEGAAALTPTTPSTTVVDNASNHIALYYSGMMLVFELGTIGQ